MFADTTSRLEWTPKAVTSWQPGDMGSTTGTYRIIERRADGTTRERSHGTYLTVWLKTPAGWRVILAGTLQMDAGARRV